MASRFSILLTGILLSASLLRAQDTIPAPVMEAIRPAYRPLAEMLAVSRFQIPTLGNHVELITNGEQYLYSLTTDILNARQSINMEYFAFRRHPESDYVRIGLALKGLEKLDVRYIVEDLMQFTKRRSYFDNLKLAGVGIQHYPLFPLNPRNHQKIVTIDGKTGYMGGMNIARQYFYEWNDTHLRIQGPAVSSMEGIFVKMWRITGGQLFSVNPPAPPFEDGVTIQIVADKPYWHHWNMQAYIWALDHAQSYFYAKTPYFSPPAKLREALRRAAARGVDVRLVLPNPKTLDEAIMAPINQSYYRGLVRGGVKIYESNGIFDHSKVFVCDDYLSSVGSVNMDGRAMLFNHEVNAYFYDEALSGQIKAMILQALENSTEVTLEDIDGRPLAYKIWCNILRIAGPLL